MAEPELPTTAETLRMLIYMIISMSIICFTYHKAGTAPALGTWCTWLLGIISGRIMGREPRKNRKQS